MKRRNNTSHMGEPLGTGDRSPAMTWVYTYESGDLRFAPDDNSVAGQQVLQGLVQGVDPDGADPGRDVGRDVAGGEEAAREAHLRRLAQAQGGLAGPPDLPAQPDLPEERGVRGERPVAEGGGHGRGHPEGGGGLVHLQPAR